MKNCLENVEFLPAHCYNILKIPVCFSGLLPFERSAFMQKTDRTETTKNTTSRDAVKNTKIKDSGAKLIFRDPVLCAQLFLTS